MEVTEIRPGLFRSSIEIDEQTVDLGCYAVQGHAEVALDVMLFKLRGRGAGDARRLPKLDKQDESRLFKPLETYEDITKQLLKELGDRKEEDLAVALKCEGLAAALHSKLPLKGERKAGAPGAGPSAAGAKPAAGGPAAKRKRDAAAEPELAAKKAAPAARKPVLTKVAPRPALAETEEPDKEKEKEQKKVKKVKPQREEAAAAAVEEEEEEEETQQRGSPDATSEPQKKAKKPKRPKKEAAGQEAVGVDAAADYPADSLPGEPKTIWIKGNPEWPANSGRYPCYVKSSPHRIGYFTLAVGMVRAVLPAMQHGLITMVDVKDAARSWQASYIVKNEAQRVPGNYSGSRYFRSLREVQAEMGIEPGDVVYFMKDEGGDPQRVRVGIWKQGSKNAEAFTAALVGRES